MHSRERMNAVSEKRRGNIVRGRMIECISVQQRDQKWVSCERFVLGPSGQAVNEKL